jgi:hypothetical protein
LLRLPPGYLELSRNRALLLADRLHAAPERHQGVVERLRVVRIRPDVVFQRDIDRRLEIWILRTVGVQLVDD